MKPIDAWCWTPKLATRRAAGAIRGAAGALYVVRNVMLDRGRCFQHWCRCVTPIDCVDAVLHRSNPPGGVLAIDCCVFARRPSVTDTCARTHTHAHIYRHKYVQSKPPKSRTSADHWVKAGAQQPRRWRRERVQVPSEAKNERYLFYTIISSDSYGNVL